MKMQNQAKLAAGAYRGHESRKHPAREGVCGARWTRELTVHVHRVEGVVFISSIITINVGFIV